MNKQQANLLRLGGLCDFKTHVKSFFHIVQYQSSVGKRIITYNVSTLSCCQGLPGLKGIKGEPLYGVTLPGLPVSSSRQEKCTMFIILND